MILKKYMYLILLSLLLSSCKSDQKTEIKTPKDTLFTKLASNKTGITFNNKISENINNFFIVYNYAYNGGGVAIGDINNDGLSDVFFTGNQVGNKLYLNKGNFQFQDITTSADVAGGYGWNNGVVMVDVNGDNLIDIYVCRGGWKGMPRERANLLFVNNGNNTFTEQAKKYNLDDIGFSMMASFFDMDNDNDLDMYLINRPEKFSLSHNAIDIGKEEENDLYRDKLYENKNGVYHEIGLQSGITNTFSYGLGLNTSDLDKDGFSDIYVANDYFESDYYFKNKGNKTFSQDIKSMTNHVAYFGMGVDVVDFNNDGYEDLIELDMTPSDHERSKVTMASMNVDSYKRILEKGNHYQYMHNMLQINNGNGFFSEISQFAGIAKTDWSWSCLGSDFDNDGYRDLFISNGFRRDVFDKDVTAKFSAYINSKEKKQRSKVENVKHIVNMFNENKIPNYIYKNNGDLKFTSKIEAWGFDDTSFSNGAAVGDLDNDGDLDLIVNNINDEAFVYRNNTNKKGNQYLKIKLNGPQHNTLGLGAKITVFNGSKIQYHEMKNVRGYLSSVDPIAHFGLGNIKRIDSIHVLWPDKRINKLDAITSNQLVNIDYKTSINQASKKNKKQKTIFKDITSTSFSGLNVKHKENSYDDFKEQILLPHKLSTNGPCIAVADTNGDGYEDFYLGGSTGQSGKLFLQKANSKFVEAYQMSFNDDLNHEDTDAIFFDANQDGAIDLYVVSGGNEYNVGHKNYQDRLYLNTKNGQFVKSNNLPEMYSSGGCVLPFDYDDDGDLDLFVGSRLIPKKYPQKPKSYLLENNKGIYTDITSKVAPVLLDLGMVTDVVWEDVNGDSKKELLVVGEWMAITPLKLIDGSLQIIQIPSLNKTSGWWNTIEASDLDKDGDIDFVLGNLGENYKFKASAEKPFYVFASDYDNNGTNDVFLAKEYKNRIVPIRGKECSSQQIPSLKKKFKTYNEFAKADLGSILDENNLDTQKQEAYCFQSIILRNSNGELHIEKLPNQAQFSTIQSILIDDYTGNHSNDVLIAGNRFNVEIETTRADASIGLLIEGNSTGLQPLPLNKSGIFLPNNVKTMKSIQLGKGDLLTKKGVLVGSNNGELKLLLQQ